MGKINHVFHEVEMDYQFIEYRGGKGNKKLFAMELKDGAKAEVRDYILKEFESNLYIQENYKLNIKRLNRWWYSVYFAKK